VRLSPGARLRSTASTLGCVSKVGNALGGSPPDTPAIDEDRPSPNIGLRVEGECGDGAGDPQKAVDIALNPRPRDPLVEIEASVEGDDPPRRLDMKPRLVRDPITKPPGLTDPISIRPPPTTPPPLAVFSLVLREAIASGDTTDGSDSSTSSTPSNWT
jgi:hypothetical protein